ncbi:MAG: hypothetical protein K5695_18395 [Oscillospiraceae bacterium]|nr:hypothetical protein [Oscillospiraceae bacterium]
MNLHDVNYYFQHKLMPELFYEDMAQFVGTVLQQGSAWLCDVHRDLFEQGDLAFPYSEEDYAIQPVKYDDGTFILLISPPSPEETPLCYCIILIFDPDFSKPAFYTLEKSGSPSRRAPGAYLCGWDAEGCHMNYGPFDVDPKKALTRCLQIYGVK